jgi:ABC-2 type transport system ATP-binding protein
MPQEPALRIANLTKRYGGTVVVENLSLEIQPGEVVGLLGPNGAGKSTTINVVSGVARPGEGRITIFGYDNLARYREARRLVGVMHQEIVIDPFFQIGQALKIHSGFYGVPDDPAWRELLIERLALGPHLHKRMNKLSGGMKRRFMVAKALIHKPRLLILDEPTAGVDVDLRRALWEFVREINVQGTTVLLTTHYLEEAEQMCGRIAIMNSGKLVTVDTTRNLMSRVDQKTLGVRLHAPIAGLPSGMDSLRPRSLEGGRTWEFDLPRDADVAPVLSRLIAIGASIADVESRMASLQDVFLKLTGKPEPGTRETSR